MKNLKVFLCISMLTVVGQAFGPSSFAQDGILSSKKGFHSLVFESMSARGLVKSGEFKYTVVAFTEKGEDFAWKKEGQFGFDESSNQTIHWFKQTFGKKSSDPNPWGATPGDGIATQTKDGIQYRGGAVFSPEISVVFSTRSRSGTERIVESPSKSSLFIPFDYRSFGYAFFADVELLTSYDKVLPNYLSVDEKDMPEIKKDKLPRFFLPTTEGARYFNHGSCLMCIDVEKDFWVTRAQYRRPEFKTVNGVTKKVGEKIGSQCVINLKQFNGHWVPTDVDYRTRTKRMDVSIEWISLNSDENKIDFSPKRLALEIEKPLASIR